MNSSWTFLKLDIVYKTNVVNLLQCRLTWFILVFFAFELFDTQNIWNMWQIVRVVCHCQMKIYQAHQVKDDFFSYFVWEIERYCNPRAMVAKEYSLKELRSLKEPAKLPLPSQLSITEGSTPMAPNASPLS